MSEPRYVALVADRRGPTVRLVGTGDSPRHARQDAARRGIAAGSADVLSAGLFEWTYGAGATAALAEHRRLAAFGPGAVISVA